MINFIDDRGEILNILEGVEIKGVSIIHSKAGSVRSNHYHENDWHYLYVISGSMKYFERDLEASYGTIDIIYKGQIVFSPPMKVHKTVFLEDTVLLCLSKEAKNANHDMIKMEY